MVHLCVCEGATKITYIIEVSFEFYGAEDWQSVAQGVCFSKDLMIKWHLACEKQINSTLENVEFVKKLSNRSL